MSPILHYFHSIDTIGLHFVSANCLLDILNSFYKLVGETVAEHKKQVAKNQNKTPT